jgi:hypothetical protein
MVSLVDYGSCSNTNFKKIPSGDISGDFLGIFKRHRLTDLAASKNGVLLTAESLSHCLTHNNWFGAQKPVLQYRQGWNSV